MICVIGNRSEWSCVKTVVDDSWRIILASAASAPKYGRIDIPKDLIEDTLYTAVEPHKGMAEATALLMVQLAPLFRRLSQPVFVVGDRFEAFASAYTARSLALPVIHLQGGEQSGTIDGELRHAISHLAQIHLVSTESAARVVRRLTDGQVEHVGCPSIDLVKDPAPANLMEINGFGTGAVFDPKKPFLVVAYHPDTLHSAESEAEVRQLWQILTRRPEQVLWITPNIDSGSDAISKFLRVSRGQNIRYLAHVPDNLFAHLLINARACIGNSSAFIRQCAFTATPAFILGTRQDGRELASNARRVTLHNLDLDNIHACTQSLLYGDGYAGMRVRQILGQCSAGNLHLRLGVDVEPPGSLASYNRFLPDALPVP